jgi:hypothetical protein
VAVIATALVGLAGIAATFFAPSWAQTKLDRRRENREFRRASRLVWHEVRKNRTTAGVFKEAVERASDVVPSNIRDLIWTGHWQTQSAVLATSLSDEDWRSVEHAYALLESVPLIFDAYVNLQRSNTDANVLSDLRTSMAETLDKARERLGQAEAALRHDPLTD